jgi:hypothetical protein
MDTMHFSDDMLAERGLPPLAFIDNHNGMAATEGKVVAVKRGEPGCYAVITALSADELNRQKGVSAAQREAMLSGSLFGWHVPAAYPSHWERLFADKQRKEASRGHV